MFKRGDRIEVNYKGDVLFGTVVSIAASKIKAEMDNGQVLSGQPSAFKRSSVPALTSNKPKFAVGDRVETVYMGETLYGVIKGVSALKATMVIDGGEQLISGGISTFKASQQPLPKDPPNQMDRWAVTKYKAHPSMSEETECFEAIITLDGVPVISAQNRGTGGPNNYYPLSNAPSGIVREFYAAADKWFEEFGSGRSFENDSLWMIWANTKKQYGVTSSQFLKSFAMEIDDMTSGRTP